MIYGLSGASSSGKTTLGRAVAEYLDLTYLPTSITECARKHGYEATDHLSLKDRLSLQWHLLNDHLEMIQKTPRPAITDRTPIDMIGYLMCEFWMNSHEYCDVETMRGAEHYVAECMKAASLHYDHIFHLSRLPLYTIGDNRPTNNPAYHRHTDLVMKGALLDLNNAVSFTVVASETLDWRIDNVTQIITARLDKFDVMRKTSRHLN